MSQTITIRKGLDVRMKGEAERIISETQRSSSFAIQPPNFIGTTPKLLVKEGEKVKAGTVLFFDKYREAIKYVSPVSGTIAEIVRGAKRRIMAVVITPDSEIEYEQQQIGDVQNMNRQEVKQMMLDSGLWPFLKMRPIDIVANPLDSPKSIFISSIKRI